MPFPTYDPLGSMDSGAATGLAIGAQVFNNNLNLQKLKSEDAVRRAQIQLHNQQLSDLLYKHDREVDFQSDMAKATARVVSETSPTVQAPIVGAPQAGKSADMVTATIPNPNRVPMEESMMRNVFPVIAKHNPQEAAMFPYRLAEARHQDAIAQAAESGSPGTFKTLTDNKGTDHQVFVPPPGRGAVSLMGDPDQQLINRGGRNFFVDRNGNLKIIPNNPAMQHLTAEEAKKILNTDPSLMTFDPNLGALVPDWNRADDIKKALAVGAGITTGTRTKVEESMVTTDNALAAATNGLDVIRKNPDAIGLLAKGRSALERAQGQLGMPTDARVAKARIQLGQDFVKLASQFRADSGNMSYYERKKLEDIGDPTGWDESPQTAEGMWSSLQSGLLGQKLRQLKTIGRTPDATLLRSLPIKEIPDLFNSDLLSQNDLLNMVVSGKLTADQAREIRANKPKG